MATTQSKFGRRFDEEFKHEVVALASRPGASDTQVARDLGVSPHSVGRWKKLYGPASGSRLCPWRQRAGIGAAQPRAGTRERGPARAEDDPKKNSRHLLRTPAMKIGVIKPLAGQHPVRKLCRTLGVTRRAYYAAPKQVERPRARENVRLSGKAREIFEASGQTCGRPRLAVALRRAGETCGRHRVARLRRRAGRRARQKRRFRPLTTDSRHLCPIAPNHLAQRAQPPAPPGEVWQADIPCVATKEGWLAVADSLEACSRKIVGWAADDTMPTALGARAFERAAASQQPASGLLHHSDRGSQYASDACRELRRRPGATPSMSRAGNGYDHAKMESVWATLKTELIDGQVYAMRAEVKSAIFRYREVFYNRTRLHGALGHPSPVDFELNLN